MSSSFLERFRNRIQKISKDGKLSIKDNLKIDSDPKSHQQHNDYENSPKFISTPTSFVSRSPGRLCRNHSNIQNNYTPKRVQSFIDTYKRPQRTRDSSQMRSSIKRRLKALPTANNYQIIHKVRFASPDIYRKDGL